MISGTERPETSADRMGWDLDADGVDQDKAAERARQEERELDGDPPPDRVPDDYDIFQGELLE